MENNAIYDISIIGLGIMGASCYYNAAKKGLKVLGLEQYSPPHDYGSSGGRSRITRQALYEGKNLQKMSLQSTQMIQEFERQTAQSLFVQCGVLNMGHKDSDFIIKIKECSIECKLEKQIFQANLNVQIMNSQQIFDKYKIKLPQDFVGVLELSGGALFPEKIHKVYFELSQQYKNSEKYFYTKVLNVENLADGNFKIITNNGIFYSKKMIYSVGKWINEMMPQQLNLNINFFIEQKFQFWLHTENKQLSHENLPIFFCEYEKDSHFYGIPNFGDGVKIGLHHDDPNQANYQELPNPSPQSVQNLLKIHNQHMPFDFTKQDILNYKQCYYTTLKDLKFLIDFHPKNKNIFIVSACSGHGFKYAPIIGQEVINMMTEQQFIKWPEFNIQQFLNQAKL